MKTKRPVARKRKVNGGSRSLKRVVVPQPELAWLHPTNTICVRLVNGIYRIDPWKAERLAKEILKSLRLLRHNESSSATAK